MIRLIRSQLYKMFHNTIFWICILITIGSVLFYSVFDSLRPEIAANGLQLVDYFSILFQNYSTGLPVLIFCVIFASEDFTCGAIHYYLAKGITRTQYYISKLITCALAAIIYVFVAAISGTVISHFLWHNLSSFAAISILQLAFFFFCQSILHISYAAFIVFTCFLFKNSVISSVFNMFLLIFGFLILHKIEDMIWGTYVISMYWPVAMFQRVQVLTAAEWFSIVAAIFVIYVLVITFIGILVTQKKDVK